MRIVLVERTMEGPEQLEDLARRDALDRSCFEERDVRRLRSFISQDQRRSICVYAAPDAGSVQDANDRAGLPYDRIWIATEDVPEP